MRDKYKNQNQDKRQEREKKSQENENEKKNENVISYKKAVENGKNEKAVAKELYEKGKVKCEELLRNEGKLKKYVEGSPKFAYTGIGGSILVGNVRIDKSNATEGNPYEVKESKIAEGMIKTKKVLPL